MENLEQAMREAAAALTGQAVETIPSGPLEEICTFIAEHYQAPKNCTVCTSIKLQLMQQEKLPRRRNLII